LREQTQKERQRERERERETHRNVEIKIILHIPGKLIIIETIATIPD
jgi:hypothetical protein